MPTFQRRAPIALIALFLAGGACAAAERGAVLRGRVTDAANHPLVGAAVNIEPGEITLVTDPDGYFTTHELAPGAYTIEVLYLGSETHTQKVRMEEGKPASILVKLRPAALGALVVTVTATRLRGAGVKA